ncbi:MAG: J domain-containing protein [Gaiellales bacterium]
MSTPDRTHYDVLGITRDADAASIRAAWKLHVQVWHPDRFNGEMRDKAEQEAALINAAYTTLRDGSRRAAYDCMLASEEDTAAATAAAAAGPASSARSGGMRRQRPAPAPSHTIHDRGAATPIGTPFEVDVPAAPVTLSRQLSEALHDVLALIRQHPRGTAMLCTALLVVFTGAIAVQVATGPSLPAGAISAQGERMVTGPSSDDAEQLADLERLAVAAREETEAADAELQQMLREDALAAEQAARQAAADGAAARAAAPRGGDSDPRAGGGRAPKLPVPPRARPSDDGPAVAPPGGRIVRIMPRSK